ncbi:MAG: gamma-glutamyltransferase [Armatimonadetes bacterium]|nr:gamma-glutamyltransferase [Armatimonadota bacterium]
MTQYEYGMVVTSHAVASAAGLEILKEGGNAVDAAVAAAFTIAVCDPSNTGIAGYGGSLVAYISSEQHVVCLDYNTRAPAAASEDMFEVKVEPDGTSSVPDHEHVYGATAIGVPGVVAGLCEALERWGTLPLSRVTAPAIRAAREGFALNRSTADLLQQSAEVFARFPATRDLFNVDPDRARFPELADTLEVLAQEGADGFYRGDLARRIVSSLQAEGSLLTLEDFASYRPHVREAVGIDYRGHEVYATPLANGGLTTLQMLRVLEGWSDYDEHRRLETAKACWERRLRLYGDYGSVEAENELGDEVISSLREHVEERDCAVWEGIDYGSDPYLWTIHLDVADTQGNVVALTQTHGGSWGSCWTARGTGLLFGHGLARFDPRPGLPNSLGPGKSPLHNMAPLLVMREGRPWAALGTPGGRTILNNELWFLVQLLDQKKPLAEALASPRLHVESTNRVEYEPTFPPDQLEPLSSLGHRLEVKDRIGGPAHGIILGDAQGQLIGATDPRGQGLVAAA